MQARATGKASLNTLVQPAVDEGCLYAPREDGPDAGEDATPVLRRRQHVKALPRYQWEERWAVSGPQRGVTCTKALAAVRWAARTANMPLINP